MVPPHAAPSSLPLASRRLPEGYNPDTDTGFAHTRATYTAPHSSTTTITAEAEAEAAAAAAGAAGASGDGTADGEAAEGGSAGAPTHPFSSSSASSSSSSSRGAGLGNSVGMDSWIVEVKMAGGSGWATQKSFSKYFLKGDGCFITMIKRRICSCYCYACSWLS